MWRQKRGLPTAKRSGVLYWGRKLLNAAPAELVTISGAGAGLWSAYSTPEFPVWAQLSLWAVVVFSVVVAGTKGIRALMAPQNPEDFWHDGFHAALNVARSTISEHCSAQLRGEQVRVTLYRVVPPLDRPEHIEQMIDTLGGEAGTGGRRFAVGQGITGRAIRTRDVITLLRPAGNTEADYLELLKKDYGYTQSAASEVSKERFSLIAVPINSADDKHAVAVLYMDAKQVDVFQSDECIKLVVACASGVQKYISERLKV